MCQATELQAAAETKDSLLFKITPPPFLCGTHVRGTWPLRRKTFFICLPFHLFFCFFVKPFLCFPHFRSLLDSSFPPCLMFICYHICPCRKPSMLCTWATQAVSCGQVAGSSLSSFCFSHFLQENWASAILKFCNVFRTQAAMLLDLDGKMHVCMSFPKTIDSAVTLTAPFVLQTSLHIIGKFNRKFQRKMREMKPSHYLRHWNICICNDVVCFPEMAIAFYNVFKMSFPLERTSLSALIGAQP